MHRLSILLLLAALAPLPAGAQTSSKSVVGVEASGPAAPVTPGATFTATVTLDIRPGYHINAQKPTEEFLIGTSLTLTPPAGLSVAKTGYPAAEYAKFSFSEEPLAVYEGTARITVTMKADADAAAGKVAVPGRVRFQACNDEQCLPPSTVDVSFDVEVGAAAAAVEEKQSLTLSGMPPDARVSIDGRQVGRADARGRYVARDLKVGRLRVRVEADGHEPWEQAVELSAARPQTLAVALVSAGDEAPPAETAPVAEAPSAAAPAAPAATAPAAPTAEEADESSTTFYVVGAIALLALVGAGAYAVTRK